MLDEEKRGTRRKEGRGGRRNEESKKMKKSLKKMENEKVAKRRIIGLAGPCYPSVPDCCKRDTRQYFAGLSKMCSSCFYLSIPVCFCFGKRTKFPRVYIRS